MNFCMVADGQLIRDNEREIVLAHRPMVGLVFVAIGGGMLYPVATGRVTQTFLYWWLGIVGAIMAAAGVAALFWRFELTLDLMARRFTRRRGFWPNVDVREGSFSELDCVRLNIELRSSGNNNSRTAAWVVRLLIRGEEKPVTVAEIQDETKAYARAESLAKRLRISLVDATGDLEKSTPWNELDIPLAERMHERSSRFTSVQIPPLPSGSRIEFINTPPQRSIVLPNLGFNLFTVFLGIFGSFFAGIGGTFLYLKIQGVPVKENPPGAAWIIAPIFLLVGLAIMFAAVWLWAAREYVQENPGEISFGFRCLGRAWRTKQIRKNDIEEVALKPTAMAEGRRNLTIGGFSTALGKSAPPRHEVCLRSHTETLRAGSGLSEEELAWLKQAITAMAGES